MINSVAPLLLTKLAVAKEATSQLASVMIPRVLSRKHTLWLHFTPKRFTQTGCHSDERVRRFILDNTEVVGQNTLTPELKLRLLTANCRFWRERPELWPFQDPFWAIYWPGGQALSRYRFGPIANDGQCLFVVCVRFENQLCCADICWTTLDCVEGRWSWIWAVAVEPRQLLQKSVVQLMWLPTI